MCTCLRCSEEWEYWSIQTYDEAMSQTSLTEDGYCEPSCKYHFPKTCQYGTVCFRWQYGNDSSVERYYFGPNMTYACPLRECMVTHAHNMHHSKSKMADGGNWRSRRTERFHMFRVWNPKTWLGNTKIIEAFVYQLSCGYRTVKSRRQPVKMFLAGHSSSASRYSSDYSAWLPLTLLWMED